MSLNQRSIDDIELHINSSGISNDYNQTHLVNAADEDLSEWMSSFESVSKYFFGTVKDVDCFFQSNVSCIESNDYQYSQLHQSSCRSMSSIISNEDLINNNNNNNLSAVLPNHSYFKRSIDQLNKDVSPIRCKKRKLLYRSVSLVVVIICFFFSILIK